MKFKKALQGLGVILSCLAFTPLFAQQPLEKILGASRNFDDAVLAGEAYFKAKHPGVNFQSLTTGTERDGEFVKFMRWQHFWQDHLNPDGTLGDISAFGRELQQHPHAVNTVASLYDTVSWTNISYEDYIGTQIGMGRTTSMAFHPDNPNIFYVGAAIGGIWKTTDGGQSYTPLGDELPLLAVSSIIVKKDAPYILYIAVGDHVWYGPPSIGVYKSINGGVTWMETALSFDFGDDIRIYWMAADPSNPQKMFAATSDGLYRTDNGFIDVIKVNSVSSFDVKFHPSDSSIVYQGGRNGEFYRSIDGGNIFSLVTDFGVGNVYAATTALNPSKVYARNDTTLHKSTDSGASFSPLTSTFPEGNSVLVFSPSNEDILIAGNFETQRSDNDGASFYPTSQWLGNDNLPLIHVDQRNIFFNPLEPDFVYYTNDGGVYRYVISTDSFVNLSDGLMITQFYDIAVSQSDENVIGGGSQDNGNVFRDTNGVWDDYAPTGDGMNQDIDPGDANTRYWSYQNGAMRRWTNGSNTGISPPNMDGEGAWETPFRLDPNNSSRLIAGYATVWESLNKGSTWVDIGDRTNFGGNLEEIAIAKSNSNRIYAARGEQLFVKDVSSSIWTAKTLPASISDLEVDPLDMNVVYITTPGFSSGQKVYRSLDAGSNWQNISGSLPNVSVGAIEIYENAPGGVFLGTDAGVYYKDPVLPDWQKYGKLPNTRVEDIEIQYTSQMIRIGTHGRGVLEASIIIESCELGAPDADNDGICDSHDACPTLDNSLIGSTCDDNDATTSGEAWSDNCVCDGGIPIASYCAAAGSDGTGSDYIHRVNVNTLNNISGQSAYSDFRELSTTLGAGDSYPLTVGLGYSFPPDEVYAWVDTDRNGEFSEAERVAMSALDSNHQSTGMLDVPADIGFSPTVMRVRSIYADPNNPDACNDYFGEVEDYTLRFGRCEARGHFGTGSDWIKNVSLHTINHDSIQAYYSDFTNLSTDLARGSSYPIEVTLNYAFDLDDAFAWIDFNQDGQYGDEELTSLSAFVLGSDSKAQGVITVPEDALPGATVMRVRSQWDVENLPTACGSYYSGEVEDYAINISYCAAGAAPGTGDDWISQVSINTIDNVSGKSDYSDFKNLSTDLIRGATYPLDVKINYGFDFDHVDVWIDFDKDDEFEESERTVMSELPLGLDSIAHGEVSVPAGAIQGETTMRVRVIYSEADTVDACGDYWGEVEDYTVNLSYCAASGADGTTADWISNVKLNTINHASEKSAYSNFKDVATVMYVGNSYPLETTINYVFPLDKVYAWVDYNQDGSFTPDERIEMSALAEGTESASLGTIDVPPGTPLGETTLRVRVIYDEVNPADPCNSWFGEVEDYTIIFSDNEPEDEIFKDGFE